VGGNDKKRSMKNASLHKKGEGTGWEKEAVPNAMTPTRTEGSVVTASTQKKERKELFKKTQERGGGEP